MGTIFSNMNQKDTSDKIFLKISFFLFTVFNWAILIGCSSQQAINQNSGTVKGQSNELPDQVLLKNELLKVKKEQEIKAYQGSLKRDFDLLHMDLSLDFDWENQIVLGEAYLKIKPFAYSQRELILDAKDFEIRELTYAGDSLVKLAYRYDESKVRIYLPAIKSSKDTFGIVMKYKAFPNKNSGNGNDAITDTKGLYFIDPLDTLPGKPKMIWTQGETTYASKWFPTIDSPNEKFTHSLSVVVPDSMLSVSNGVLVSQLELENGKRKDSWEMNLPHSAYLVALAIGDFAQIKSSYGSLPLGYFVEKGYEQGAKKVFENTPEMLGLFEKKLGVKYPWPKYDQVVVRDFVSGAMENTTVSIFMEELLLDERESIDSEWDYIIAHELFHHWFGDLVTAESWANLTLNEGFANYSEYIWNEYKYGKDQADLKLVAEREGYFSESEKKRVDLIRFDNEGGEDMFDAHSYNKGGLVLHMLRDYLGDEVFFQALNNYLTEHQFQSVEVHDLRIAFEEASGMDLNWFFNQWFLDKGHPELVVEVDYSQPLSVLIQLEQQQDLNEFPLFQFPLEVSWYEGDARKSQTFFIDKVKNEFVVESQNPINQVYLNERNVLLASISQKGISDEQLIFQFKNSDFGVARYAAFDSLKARNSESIYALVAEALSDPFWSIRENALGFLFSNTEQLIDHPEWENLVFEIAEKDQKNSVRSAAIDVIGEYDADKFFQSLKLWAKDSSYLVVGSALMALVQSEGIQNELSWLEQFEKEKNFRIVIPLAEFYIRNQTIQDRGQEKEDWFFEQITNLKGEGLYYFLGYFSEYFANNLEKKDLAIEYLLTLLSTHEKEYVRRGAFEALLSFSDRVDVIEKIKSVLIDEKSESLRNYSRYFLDMLSDEN